MDDLGLTDSSDDLLEDVDNGDNSKTLNFDGESDKDVCYEIGGGVPFERK